MSFVTNVVAICFILVGLYVPYYSSYFYSIGIFAFSGAITNWIAIHMLFEKVPFLYGSGVIPNRFQEFKAGIKKLIMTQFFTRENLERFLKQVSDGSSGPPGMQWDKVSEAIDYKKVFYALIDLVNQSPLGGMLMMMGGEAALTSFEQPFTEKMKVVVKEIVSSDSFKEKIKEFSGQEGIPNYFLDQIEHIVENRLNELTPKLVKEIVQEMIRKHLGWLVVWGGVFGGLIGLIAALINA